MVKTGQMNRRDFLKAAGASAAAISLTGCMKSAVKAADKKYNIIYIMTDDHASHAMSCYGSRINTTPNLDRIANEGMRFDNCFVTNSICAPCRAVVLTGKYSHINGVLDNRLQFDGSQQTFPKILQQQGYQTAMIGKWHLKTDPTGFDYWNVLPGQGNYYNPDMIEMGERKRFEGYVTDIITDKALEWLKNRDMSKPFLLMYQHKAPHRRWEPGPDYLNMYDNVEIPEPVNLFDDYETRSDAARQQEMTVEFHLTPNDLKLTGPPSRMNEEQKAKWNQAYDAKNKAFENAALEGKDLIRWKYQRYMKDYLRCVASVDDNIGRVLDWLNQEGLADNTVVIYTSDQGFYLGDHGWFDKRFMYEESYRSPLLVRCPGLTKPGSVNDDIVLNLDFGPTMLDLAGARVPSDMQGESFKSILAGKTPPDWRQAAYYHYFEYPAVHVVKRHYGIRTKRYKLIHFYYDIDAWEMYDLQKDPHEMNNVFDNPDYAGKREELMVELYRLKAYYGDTREIEDELMAGKNKADQHPDFAGVYRARIKNSTFGYDIDARSMGCALKRAEKPFKDNVSFKCLMRSLLPDGTRNGFICFGSKEDPDDIVKAGVFIGAGEYIIMHGNAGQDDQMIRHPGGGFNKGKVFDVEVTVDIKSKKIVLNVDGTEVTGNLNRNWKQIGYYGYCANSTRTSFSKIEVSGS